MEKTPFTLSFISEAHQSLTEFSAWREEEKHQMTVLGCYLDKVVEMVWTISLYLAYVWLLCSTGVQMQKL